MRKNGQAGHLPCDGYACYLFCEQLRAALSDTPHGVILETMITLPMEIILNVFPSLTAAYLFGSCAAGEELAEILAALKETSRAYRV